jgi:hypothetical protein
MGSEQPATPARVPQDAPGGSQGGRLGTGRHWPEPPGRLHSGAMRSYQLTEHLVSLTLTELLDGALRSRLAAILSAEEIDRLRIAGTDVAFRLAGDTPVRVIVIPDRWEPDRFVDLDP